MKAPKEKATELIEQFCTLDEYDAVNDIPIYTHNTKQCALICCEEILKEIPMYTGNLNPKWKYWQEVKEEITKL